MNARLNPEFPDPYTLALDQIDVSDPKLMQANLHWDYFKRLREEAPVHLGHSPLFGPFWSITRFKDIMAVEKNYEAFSSSPRITLPDPQPGSSAVSFISMDPPKHDVQRKTVQGVVAPMNLAKLEHTIRERVQRILDNLPIGEPFNWVQHVSIELTTQMLATIFNFPFEHRHKLTYWSDIATSGEDQGGTTPAEEREAGLAECLEWFTRLRAARVKEDPKPDLLSMLAHGEHTQEMPEREFLGNLILLIVGGNDTTRNSISGGVVALNENPEQYQKLRDNTGLIPSMVSEIIRYQTPLAYMRRTVTQDIEFQGQKMKAGDKVAMWYVSGNRDEQEIDRPNEFLIDRKNPRHHLSFGFGVHRCMGNRLAEMQLRILWENIMERFRLVEMVGPIERVQSSFVRGYEHVPVIVHPI